MPFDFSSPFAQTILKQYLGKQYGGQSRQTNDIFNSIIGSSGGTSSGSVLTDNSSLLAKLKGMSETGMSGLDTYRQNAQTAVNTNYNKASTGLSESLAQSGLFRSGVGTAGKMSLEAGRSNALGNVETNLMKENEAYKANALAQLLGFTNAQDALKLQESGLDQNALLALLGYGQTTATEETDNNSSWGNILGSLISAGGKVAAAVI